MTRRTWLAAGLTLMVGLGPALGRAPAPADDDKSLSDLLKLLKSKDPEVRADAAREIGRIEEKARSALPALLELSKDKDLKVRLNAVDAVGEIGVALRGKGPDVRTAVAALIEALKGRAAAGSEEHEVLLAILSAISRIAEEEPAHRKAVVAAAMPFLKHEHTYVKRDAADALQRCKAAAKPAVPALIEVAKGEDAVAAGAAREALRDIDPEAAKKAGVID